MTDRKLMTSEGHDKLGREIQKLKAERSDIVRAIEAARLLGDLSENADYDAAKRAQALNFARLGVLEDMLASAAVISPAAIKGDKVSFGVTVELLNLQTDEVVVYKVVCAYEAAIENGLLSVESPLARALLGKKEGDVAELRLPKGDRQYEILKIMVNS